MLRRRAETPTTSVLPIPGLVQAVAPDSIEFHDPWLQIGDYAASVLAITAYPPQAGVAWLSRLFTLPGVFGSIHLGPTDSGQLVKAINSSLTEFRSRLLVGSRNSLLVQRTQKATADAGELLRTIDQEQQTVFVFTALLLVIGADREEMEQRRRAVISTALAQGMRPKVLT